MKLSLRGWFVVGVFAAVIIALAVRSTPLVNAADNSRAASGGLTESSLGNLLAAMGLTPKKEQKRYDFDFKAIHHGEEWQLSMSAVLSENGKSVWVMAWLDELPRTAADVPRTALLRLLASNDRLGSGKFFAYIASNRRFVLQRVIPNENMTTVKFRNVLKDLGASVVQTYPHWSVTNWKRKSGATSAENGSQSRGGASPASRTQRKNRSSASTRNSNSRRNSNRRNQ